MNVRTQQVLQIATYRAFNIPHPHANVAIIAYRGARAFIEVGTPLDQAQSGLRVSRIRIIDYDLGFRRRIRAYDCP
jgi:hypothetical protein